ncbi:putative metallocarboxypeptidase ecm14 [Gnomoniopsis sp. IMI 355080]|nr:putative metallocarboxypeptidase ecm14 [Gnomoniopsis sp. IMI 355080]
MRPPSSALLPLLLAASPLLTLTSARPQARSSVLPILSWIRDSAVRIVFGGPHISDNEEPLTAADVYQLFSHEIIVRFNVTTVEEERALAKATEQIYLDVWSWGSLEGTVDLRIQKPRLRKFLELLPPSLHEAWWVMIEDLPSAIWNSYPSTAPAQEQPRKDGTAIVELNHPRSPGDGDEGLYFFRDYQPHNVVVRWMRLIEAMFPSFVRFTVIGQSYEGRDIPALTVSGNSDARDPLHPRKTLVVMGGSHAREWISTTTVNYLAWALITSYGKDKRITKFLQAYDIIFIPEMNPDGIEYTWDEDRLWRKSRQTTRFPWCRGLDLDHAFGYEWDTWRDGHWNEPCSESYAGEQPWQSVEVSAFRDWAKREAETNNVDFVGLIDLHSYSQQILFPYAYTCDIEPPNLETMEELALGLAKSIRLFSGETYSVKPACQGAVPETRSGANGLRIEPSGGSAIDWFYHELGARYSYQIKLRDTGSYGFLLPADQIIPTGEEILGAMKYLGDFLLGNDGIEHLSAEEGVETQQSLFAVSQESEQIMELKRRKMK